MSFNSLEFSSFLAIPYADAEISLPWGNPPKPNIWQARAKGEYNHKIITISSPILKDTLTIDIKVDESWGTVVSSNVRSGDIQYRAQTPLSKYEGQTLNDFLKDVWTRKVSKDKRFFKFGNMKVASSVSGSMSFLEFLATKHTNAKMSLPWGNPPKPNIWQAMANGDANSKNIVILSPFLKHPITIIARVHVNFKGGEDYLRGQITKNFMGEQLHSWDTPLKAFESDSLDDFLKNLWDYVIKSLRSTFLKDNMKVASSVSGSMRFLKFMTEIAGEGEISLPWGSPPKPNLWKAQFKTPYYYDKYNKLIEIRSPVLREKLKLEITFQKNLTGTTYVYFFLRNCNFEQQITSWWADTSEYKGKTLNDVLKEVWAEKIKPETKKYILKENIKVGATKTLGVLRDLVVDNQYKAKKEIILPWGDPPKPNLWKVELKEIKADRESKYHVRSPLLLDAENRDYSLDIFYTKSYDEIHIRFGFTLYGSSYGLYSAKFSGETGIDYGLKEFWGGLKKYKDMFSTIDRLG